MGLISLYLLEDSGAVWDINMASLVLSTGRVGLQTHKHTVCQSPYHQQCKHRASTTTLNHSNTKKSLTIRKHTFSHSHSHTHSHVLSGALMRQWIVLVWTNTDRPKITRGREGKKKERERITDPAERQSLKEWMWCSTVGVSILTSVLSAAWPQYKSSQCLQVSNDPVC